MKIKDGFVLREVAGSFVVMNVGSNMSFDGMITLNETGALIWNLINEGLTEIEIASRVAEEYDIDTDTALRDTEGFIKKLSEADIFE